jgi:putative restriction endonuclease
MKFKQFEHLNQASVNGRRAPHKPLLVLLMLAKVQKKQGRLVAYADIEFELRNLLKEFGPTTRSYKPELPFFT